MNLPNLLADLRRDEGCRLEAYPDPLSGGEPWTIGYGHASPDVHKGLVWTQTWAEEALESDAAKVCAALDKELPWWRNLDDVRQNVLANMGFNLGVAKLLTFGTFLGFVKSGQYAHAALDMLGTAWARQVGQRARRLSLQLRTGVQQ